MEVVNNLRLKTENLRKTMKLSQWNQKSQTKSYHANTSNGRVETSAKALLAWHPKDDFMFVKPSALIVFFSLYFKKFNKGKTFALEHTLF